MNSDSLDPQLVLELLGYLADDNVVLVGGQSVMFWAHHYQLVNQHESFTTDIDLFGNSADIEAADARLIAVHHETKYAELDDSSPNSGVILINATGRAKVRVDYLWSVYGLAGSDIQERPDEFGLVRWPQMQQRLDKARMALGKRLPNKPDVSNTLRMRF